LCAYVVSEQKRLPPRPLSEKPDSNKPLAARPGEVQEPFNVHFTTYGSGKLAELVAGKVNWVLKLSAVHPQQTQ